MSDIALSIVIFHSLATLLLTGAVLLSAFIGRRGLRATRRLPVIARAHFPAPKSVPARLPDYDTLPAAA